MRQRARQYPEDRKCDECGKTLSIYNPNSKCWCCHPMMVRTATFDPKTRRVVFRKEPIFGTGFCATTVCSSRTSSASTGSGQVYNGKSE